MSDSTYSPKVYRKQGGDEFIVASGGSLDVESGGALKIAGTDITSTLTELGGGLTGTKSASFTVDSDATLGKVKIQAAAGAANKTLTLTNAALTDNRTITFPDATGTVQLSASTDLTAGADGVAGTLTVYPATASNGKLIVSAADSAGDFDLTLQNKAVGQDTTVKIPDPGVATAQVPLVTSDNKVLITAAADRTVTLGGNLSTAANLTVSGAFAAEIAVPSASTWTLPAGGGNLALATGNETGTTNNTFDIDSDNLTGKLQLKTTIGGTNNTVTVTNTATSADRTITLPDATGTVALTNANQTISGNLVHTGTSDFKGNVSASANNPNIDYSGSSGTFKTCSGENTLSGNVTISGAKTLTTGTGAIALNGPVTVAADQNVACAAGTTAVDFSLGTGVFKTSTGANTLSGSTTIAANKNLDCEAGTTAVDLSLGTGAFKTTTGANQLSGAVTIADATTPSLTTASGKTNTGFVQVNGKTSGGIKILPPDAGTNLATISMEAQTQACTFKLPDLNVAAAQLVGVSADFSVNVVTVADRTLTLGGNVTTAGAVDLGDHAMTLNTTGATEVTLPTTGTLATLDGAEALTNKTIDGDSNTLSDIGPASAKVGVVGVRGGAVPVIGLASAVCFDMDNTAGSSTWTNATGQSFKITGVLITKTDANGGAADTVQLFNGGNAITAAITLQVNDNVVACPLATQTFDDAYMTIANGGTLVVTTVKGTDHCECEVRVTGILV